MVNVISLPYIFLVFYVLRFTRQRYQVSVYRTIGPLVSTIWVNLRMESYTFIPGDLGLRKSKACFTCQEKQFLVSDECFPTAAK